MARTRRSSTYQISLSFLIFIQLCLMPRLVLASGDWLLMSGELGIGKSSIADPSPEMDSVAYLVIKGKAAEKIYKSMKVKPKLDLCTNFYAKQVGNLSCTKNKNNITCDIGINLNTGESTYGRPC